MPASYPIPPWLSQGADPAGQYATGLQIGVRIGAEQAKQNMVQQQLLRQQSRDEFERQYETAKLQMETDRMSRVTSARGAFQQAVQSGMDPAQALMRFGPDMGESVTDVLRVQGMADQRTRTNELREQQLEHSARTADLRGRELDLRERNIDRLSDRYSLTEVDKAKLSSLYAELRGVNTALAKIPPMPSDDEDDQAIANRTALVGRKTKLQRQINQLGQTQQAAEPVGQRVRVVSPTGKTGTIPASQLDEALNAGYQRID